MKNFRGLFLLAVLVVLNACGGGGGGVTAPGPFHPGQSDQEFLDKANAFIKQKSTELGVQLSIAKLNTDQKAGFIVVHNPAKNNDSVYNINGATCEYCSMTVLGQVDKGSFGSTFTSTFTIYSGSPVKKDGDSYYYYTDYNTGKYQADDKGYFKEVVYDVTVRFEEVSGGTKDLEAAYASRQDQLIEASSENIQASFGLSEEKSLDLAKMVYNINKNQSKSLTMQELNQFSKELLNLSMDELKSASQSPNSNQSVLLLEKAAKANNISSEHMKAIIQDLF